MARDMFGMYVPTSVPGEDLEKVDMERVTEDDFAEIRSLARRYCSKVNATRSRKRMDGSATIARGGYAPYGTDDVSDDVCQDAVLIFAKRLSKIMNTCDVASVSVDTREADGWQYVTEDGNMITANRAMLRAWAVRDAGKRNGYRTDVPPDEIDATPGAQTMRGVRHAEHLVTTSHLAHNSANVLRMAWGDGADFPTLGNILFLGSMADDLGRAGILATVAQSRYGGAYGSRRNVRRVRDMALDEWSALSARLDEARDTLVYRGARDHSTD